MNAALLVTICLAVTAQAATEGDWIYEIISDFEENSLNEVAINGYTGLGGIVTIPSNIGGLPVTVVGRGWNLEPIFSSDRPVTSLVIPEGVKEISGGAFNGCSDLEYISIPNTVESIGPLAFSNCSRLENVNIPAGVTYISPFAFNHCSSLTNFSVSAVNQVYASEDGILLDKQKSTLIAFPMGRAGHFQIPTNVVAISYAAFVTATNLTSVYVPQTVTNIALWPFAACFGLTNIAVSADNMVYESSDGVLYSKGLSTLVTFPAGKGGAFIIPNTVTSIADVAFKGCPRLTYVSIPHTVTNLGSGLFVDCIALAEVSLPNSVVDIPSDAFANCTSLTGVSFPNGVTSIGSGAFQDCSNLVSLTIPSGVTNVEFSAFIRSGLQKAYFLGALPRNWSTADDPDSPIMFPPGYVNYLPTNTVILYRPGASGWASFNFKGQPNGMILPRFKNSLLINTNSSTKYMLSFETVSGIQYSVQKTTTLGVWSNIWTTSGDGLDKIFQEDASDRAFYRILQH